MGGSNVLPHPRHGCEGRVLEDLWIESHPGQSPGTGPTGKACPTSRGDGALSAPPRPSEGCLGITVDENPEVQPRS